MAYSVIDKVYTIFIDVMTGSSNGYGKPTFYNTDSHTSFIELTVTNGSKEFNMTEFSYMFTVEKPDGTKYTNEYTTQDKSKLVIPVDAQMISCTGNCNAQLYVNKEVDGVNKTLTMVEFNYTVYKGLHEGLISESIDFDNVYVKILNKLDYIINNGADLTGDQAAQLAYAYQHSKSPHAPANIVETMHTEIGEAIDAHHKKVALSASQVGSYKGTDITVKPSNEGLTNNLEIWGKTMQNVCVKPIFNYSGSHTKEDMAEYIKVTSIDASFCYAIVSVRGTLFVENKPYTLVYDREDSSDSIKVTLVRCIYNDDTFLDTVVAQTGKVVASFTPKKPINRIEIYCYATREDVKVGAWVKVYKKVLILEGDYTTPDAYIPPYFEGIKSVGDKSKNLFKGYDQEIQLEAGKTYYLSSADTMGATRIYIKPTAKDDISSSQMYWQSSSSNYTLSADYSLLRVTITCNNNTTIVATRRNSIEYNEVQLEEGTVPTAYEPHFEEGTSLIRIGSHGKNLVDNSRNMFGTADVDNGIVSPVKNCVMSDFIDVSGLKDFYIKAYGEDLPVTYRWYDKDKNYIGAAHPTAKPLNYHYLRLRLLEITTIKEPKDALFYLSDEPLPKEYEPYQEDIKEITANISDGLKGLTTTVADAMYFDRVRQEIWSKQMVGVYTLTGDEVLSTSAGEPQPNTFHVVLKASAIKCKKSSSLICNNLPNHEVYSKDRAGIYCHINGDIVIAVNKSWLETPDLEGLRKWLKANPTTIYFELENPKYTKISSSNTNLKTFVGTTHVFSKNDFKPSIFFGLDFVPMTTDTKQFCSTNSNKNFILPDVASLQDSNALEIHLFVKMLANATLSFPSSILWNDLTKMSEITNGSVAEFIFTYIKTTDGDSWLGTVVPHK